MLKESDKGGFAELLRDMTVAELVGRATACWEDINRAGLFDSRAYGWFIIPIAICIGFIGAIFLMAGRFLIGGGLITFYVILAFACADVLMFGHWRLLTWLLG